MNFDAILQHRHHRICFGLCAYDGIGLLLQLNDTGMRSICVIATGLQKNRIIFVL